MAAWEANGTLSLGYRKVGSVALIAQQISVRAKNQCEEC